MRALAPHQLVFIPRTQERPSIARPEWGRPTAFGSAARVEALVRALPRDGAAASEQPPASAPQAAAQAGEAGEAPAAPADVPLATEAPAVRKRGRGEAAAEQPGAKRAETLTPRRGVKRGSCEPEEAPPAKAAVLLDGMET